MDSPENLHKHLCKMMTLNTKNYPCINSDIAFELKSATQNMVLVKLRAVVFF